MSQEQTTSSQGEHLDLVDEEIIRARVRKMIDEPKPQSLLQKLTSNQALLVIVTFLCTGVVGAYVAYYYNQKLKLVELNYDEKEKQVEFDRDSHQKELAYLRDRNDKESTYQRSLNEKNLDNLRNDHMRELEDQRAIQQKELEREGNFAIELNKTRVARISEVWEQIYTYEAELEKAEKKYQDEINETISRLETTPTPSERAMYRNIKRMYGSPPFPKAWSERMQRWLIVIYFMRGTTSEIFETSNASFQSLTLATTKNRFWLGEDNYRIISDYISATRDYIAEKVKEPAQTDQTAIKAHTERLRELTVLREKYRRGVVDIRDRLLKQ